MIILDLGMPVMSGREILSILRKYLRLSRIPVVIISAEPPTSATKGANVVGHLTKPYSLEKLLALVERGFRAPGVAAA